MSVIFFKYLKNKQNPFRMKLESEKSAFIMLSSLESIWFVNVYGCEISDQILREFWRASFYQT